MAKLGKAHHIAHRSVCSLGKTVNFAATPYEGQTEFIGAHNPSNPVGYSWDTATSAQYGFLASPPPEGTVAAGYHKDYANPRPDMNFISFKGGGMGFSFAHQVRGRGLKYDDFKGNRSIRTELYEVQDAADSTWECYSGGHVASSIISQDGPASRIANNGEEVLTIQSTTPDAFLAGLALPQMPYILAGPANAERYAQWFLNEWGWLPPPAPLPNPLPTSETKKASIQNVLGYQLQGSMGYVDPFSGFAYYRDQYTMKVGELMTPAPANDLHFFNALSSSRVVVEILTNHVLANRKSIGKTFSMEVLTGQDIESDLLHFEVSGGINSIINEAAQHGVWRTWWDSRSNFHFILDYYGGGGGGKVAATLVTGPSLIGELEICRATSEPRLNREAVRGQPFLSFGDAQTDPMSNNFDMVLGAVYPPGRLPGGDGSDDTQDNYMGKNAAAQAFKLFQKNNARTTFNWKNVPYPGLVMGLLYREINIKAKDPKGAWDFSNGKRFIVTEVNGQLQDPDSPGGGYWECSASGIEI